MRRRLLAAGAWLLLGLALLARDWGERYAAQLTDDDSDDWYVLLDTGRAER